MNLVRVLVCHGAIIDRDPARVLAAIADRLAEKRRTWTSDMLTASAALVLWIGFIYKRGP